MDNALKVYFSGPSESVAPGSTISVGVLVDSGSPINAFDFAIVFPVDKFEFLGSDNTGSIVDIWQTKPSVDIPGKVVFSGGILEPFSGVKGSLVKLSFKVLDTSSSADLGKISFEKRDLFVADGQGTKVVASPSDINISIKANAEVTSTPFIPFQPTQTDVIIEEGVKKIEAEQTSANSLTYLLVFALIIFVICCVAVYNKTKHKL